MAKTRKPPTIREQQSSSFLSTLSPTTQDLLCVLFLYAVTLVLFRAIVFDNAAFSDEGDTINALSYAHVGDAIREKEGIDPIWMPYFFSGMPTFGNVHYIPHDVSYLQTAVVAVLKLFYLNSRWGWFPVYYLLAGAFMFLLLRVWNLPRTAALLGALTYMLSPYAMGLAGEGHGSKLMGLSYLPLLFLLTQTLMERRNLLSFGLLAAAIGTLLLTNHMQIAYYAFVVIGLYLLYQIVLDIPRETLLALKKTALFAGALLLGFSISAYIYLSVYEYAPFSIRGGGTAGAPGGLTWDYATNWSWHPVEFFTLLVPAFLGFQSPYYWGTMPFTNSTVYVGIIPLLLSILALIYRRNRMTIFLAILTAIVFLMSFGKHFPLFYGLLFEYLPFFNKFRAPAMILHLIAFTFAILGAYGFTFLKEGAQQLTESQVQKLKKGLTVAAAIIGGLLLIGLLASSIVYDTLSGFMFVREGELDQLRERYGQQSQQALSQLKRIRFDLLWDDYVKFALIAGCAMGATVLFLRKKIGAGTLGGALIGILLVDLLIMDVKFIHPKPSTDLQRTFKPDATITFLKQQEGLFRILPLPVFGPLYQDNSFAYHGIQSIGGYSPAKLKIYQTMVDSCLLDNSDPSFPMNMKMANMLNGKYIVAPFQLPPETYPVVHVDQAKRVVTHLNPRALPRAFFVQRATVAQNQTEVFRRLNSSGFDPSVEAILEKPLEHEITVPESTSAVITDYRSSVIAIRAFTSSPALLVLSEIYYPAGWRAFIDDEETPIYKTNYVLRSVVVPPGVHTVEFRFEPESYRTGWLITHIGWGVTALCVVVGLWMTPSVRRRLTLGGPARETGS